MSQYKGDYRRIPESVRKRLPKIHVLTHAELRRLFSVITDLRDRAMFLVAYRHGLRASEVALLKTGDLDLDQPKITIRRLGGRTPADHDLQKDESVALRLYLESRNRDSVILFTGSGGRPISRRGLDWLMKQYCEHAKLPGEKRHFHALKHSIATHLFGAGADLRFIHEWLGHTVLQSTAVYLYLAKAAPGDKSRSGWFPKLA